VITMTRLLRALIVTAVVVLLAMPAAGPVLAERSGDLYATSPGETGTVLNEIDLLGQQVILPPTAVNAGSRHLAFTDIGTLYLGDGGVNLERVNVKTLETAMLPQLPAAATDIAHPTGTSLYLAYPSRSALGILAAGQDTPVDGQTLTGPADLLAADRRETRLLAAEVGKSWVDIVNTTTNDVAKVTVVGSVVAAAISGVDHVAYVVTADPNTVVAITLDTAKVAWTAALPNRPTAVTASWDAKQPASAIVAVGASLYAATGGTAKIWATLPDAASALVTSDEGRFVYAASTGGVVAISVEKPTAAPVARVDLTKPPLGMAALPDVSSLAGDGGQASGSSASPGAPGQPSPTPRKTKAPATDTVGGEDGTYRAPGADLVTVFGGMIGIAIVVLLLSRNAIRRWMGE